MARDRIGKLKPRYSFMLNPYSDVRLTRCPRCQRPTHLRKFALFIHVEDGTPVVLGKTCRYCTPCELVIVHRDELEAELANGPTGFTPRADHSGYVVLGTVDRKVWQKGLTGSGMHWENVLANMADFKKHFDLHVEPGGWRPANEGKTEPH
jgi:hypothetical protein